MSWSWRIDGSSPLQSSPDFVPITDHAATQLLVTEVIPLVPLLLTLMPLNELMRRLVGLMFGRLGA
jgi:hypothetical protein